MIRRVVVFVPHDHTTPRHAETTDHVVQRATHRIDDGGAKDEQPTSDEPGCTEDPGLRR